MFSQVHDRDALPQPQFVAPVLETAPPGSRSATPVAGKSSKPPVKAPSAKSQVLSRPVSRGQPVGLNEASSQAVAGSPPTEYGKPWLLCHSVWLHKAQQLPFVPQHYHVSQPMSKPWSICQLKLKLLTMSLYLNAWQLAQSTKNIMHTLGLIQTLQRQIRLEPDKSHERQIHGSSACDPFVKLCKKHLGLCWGSASWALVTASSTGRQQEPFDVNCQPPCSRAGNSLLQ